MTFIIFNLPSKALHLILATIEQNPLLLIVILLTDAVWVFGMIVSRLGGKCR